MIKKLMMLGVALACATLVTGCGNDSESLPASVKEAQNTCPTRTAPKESPNQTFNRYAKTRNLSFTFRGKVWARFVSLPKDEQEKTAAFLARMMEKDK